MFIICYCSKHTMLENKREIPVNQSTFILTDKMNKATNVIAGQIGIFIIFY